jgi:hypothetical protein
LVLFAWHANNQLTTGNPPYSISPYSLPRQAGGLPPATCPRLSARLLRIASLQLAAQRFDGWSETGSPGRGVGASRSVGQRPAASGHRGYPWGRGARPCDLSGESAQAAVCRKRAWPQRLRGRRASGARLSCTALQAHRRSKRGGRARPAGW